MWYTPEGYEITCVKPDLFILYGPDGWVDYADSYNAAQLMCEALQEKWIKEHPV